MTQPNPYTEPLPSEYEMIPAKITSLNVTNIRSNRSLTSDEIIRLEKGTDLEVKISEGAMWADAGYYWRKIEFDNKIWWVAYEDGQGNKLSLVVSPIVTDVSDTPDEPTEPDDTPTDTSELIARLDALEVTNTALNERITALENAITKMLEPVILDAPDVSWTAPRFALPMVASMFAGLERQFSIQKEWAQSGTPTPPVSAQNIKFPTASEIADIGFAASDNSEMFDEKGNITITNEPDSEAVSTVSNDDDDSEELDIAV